MWYSSLTSIRATNRFIYFAATAAQRSDRRIVLDPDPHVITRALSKEKEKDDNLGQGGIVPYSLKPAHQEPSLPGTEVVGKYVNDFLRLLHVK